MDEMEKIGVIGGTGLYEISGLEGLEEVVLDTPFGAPSDSFCVGTLDGRDVVFLARHGREHMLLPSEINYRANIFGMKKLGVGWIISASAVGSYREEIAPRDIVVIDQFFDRTKQPHNHTFFGDGIAVHVSFAHPICPALSRILYDSGVAAGAKMHKGGTYVNMEGPAFSTKAESLFFKRSGMDVIGMTNLVEARLSREAEICYSTLALVTDYDAWHEEMEVVSVEQIVENLQANAETARAVIKDTVSNIPSARTDCECVNALETSIMTSLENVPDHIKEKLSILIGKYL